MYVLKFILPYTNQGMNGDRFAHSQFARHYKPKQLQRGQLETKRLIQYSSEIYQPAGKC